MLRGKKRYDDKMRHFHEHRLTSMERHGSDVHGFQNDVHKGINEVEVVSDCKQSREAQDGSDGQSRENMLQNSSLDKPSSCDKGFQVGNRITIPEQFSTQGREFANRNAARQSKKNLRNEMIQLRRESHSSHSSSFNSINSLVVSSHSFEMNHTSTTSRTSSHTSSRFSYNSQHHYIKNKQNQHIKSSSKDSVNCSVGYVSSSSGDYTFYRKLKSKESRHQKDLYYVKELINRQRNHYIKKFRKELEWLEKVEDYLALADNSNQSAFTESASSSSLMSGRLHLLTKLESLRINRGKHQERQKTRNLPTRSSYMSDHENQNGSLITEKHQLTLSSQDSELVGPVPSDQAEVGMNRVHSSFTTDSGTQTSINIYKEPLDQDRKTHIDEKKTINEDSSRRRQRASSKDQDISQGLSSDELKNNAWFIPFHQMSAEDCPYCQRQQQVLQITFKGGPSLSRLSLQVIVTCYRQWYSLRGKLAVTKLGRNERFLPLQSWWGRTFTFVLSR